MKGNRRKTYSNSIHHRDLYTIPERFSWKNYFNHDCLRYLRLGHHNIMVTNLNPLDQCINDGYICHFLSKYKLCLRFAKKSVYYPSDYSFIPLAISLGIIIVWDNQILHNDIPSIKTFFVGKTHTNRTLFPLRLIRVRILFL